MVITWIGVILHSVRPSFWKKRDFSHAPRCGSTESGCEISIPWWLILADQGKMTSVWSRDRDTGDTSEVQRKQDWNWIHISPALEFHNFLLLEIELKGVSSPLCRPTSSATHLCPEKHQANYRGRSNWGTTKRTKLCIDWSISSMVLLHNKFDFFS